MHVQHKNLYARFELRNPIIPDIWRGPKRGAQERPLGTP